MMQNRQSPWSRSNKSSVSERALASRVEAARPARALARLDRSIQKRLITLLERLAASSDPRRLGRPLQGHRDLWRFRTGDHRVIAQLRDDELIVLVLKIGHRREVYRKLPDI